MTKRLLLLLALVIAVLTPVTPASATGLPTTTFRAATFNALGYSHTDLATGNAQDRLSARQRTAIAVEVFDNRHLDVIALQEFQHPQQVEFRQVAGTRYGLYCPPDPIRRDNCVAWRRATFRLVDSYVLTVPYFYGQPRKMPVVLLRARATGQLVVVDSVHNPCDCNGPAETYRTRGWAHEATMAHRVAASARPVLLMGDRNVGVAQYAPHLPARFHLAGRVGIDFIAGSSLVRFSGYQSVRPARVRQATDHPLVYVDVSIPNGWIR